MPLANEDEKTTRRLLSLSPEELQDSPRDSHAILTFFVDLLVVVQGLIAILAVGRLRPGHLDLACDNVGVCAMMATMI